MRPLPLILVLAACSPLSDVGRAPPLTATLGGDAHAAMASLPFPATTDDRRLPEASLWSGGPQSLLGDRRATVRGDILTVVVEIDDSAEISASSDRTRTGSETMGVPALLGLPQRLNAALPEGASLETAVDTNSGSRFAGDGSVRRAERLTLRVAATVLETLPNGILRIEGSQEVRVSNELRELIVTGYVRPQDISRRNEITYDKIAAARISYGGRGAVAQAQAPRWGQQAADILLPF